MKTFSLLVLFSIALVLNSACTTLVPRNPAPITKGSSAQIPGITNARFWGDDIPTHIEHKLKTLSDEEIRTGYPALYKRPHNYLALSGGGQNGAFGAGLLTGWSEAGNRPEFQMVTGISTGALAAPFAFLGPSYDHVLKEVYTSTRTEDILDFKNWVSILLSDAAADSSPLMKMIRRHVTDDIIDAIAAAHRKGRRLYIGTTDIDRMRPRIWDIGEIAASGQKGSKSLIHKIMLASASIPGAFPPVRISVESGGKLYDELHVDGGTTSQVFVYPAAINWQKVLRRLKVPGAARIFVIRNASLVPHPEHVRQRILPIAGRSISSLIRTQGIGDLYLIYMLSKRDGTDYNLAYIPDDFDEESKESFDIQYMNKLFELGYTLSRNGYKWEKTPPGWVR
jgi:predicted patatin/cPLA2 family phospholipase